MSDANDDRAVAINEEIATYKAIMTACKDKTGEAAMNSYKEAEAKHKECCHQLTRLKPLDKQENILTQLVARKKTSLEKAEIALVTAQEAHDFAQSELAEAQLSLQRLMAEKASALPYRSRQLRTRLQTL